MKNAAGKRQSSNVVADELPFAQAVKSAKGVLQLFRHGRRNYGNCKTCWLDLNFTLEGSATKMSCLLKFYGKVTNPLFFLLTFHFQMLVNAYNLYTYRANEEEKESCLQKTHNNKCYSSTYGSSSPTNITSKVDHRFSVDVSLAWQPSSPPFSWEKKHWKESCTAIPVGNLWIVWYRKVLTVRLWIQE